MTEIMHAMWMGVTVVTGSCHSDILWLLKSCKYVKFKFFLEGKVSW